MDRITINKNGNYLGTGEIRDGYFVFCDAYLGSEGDRVIRAILNQLNLGINVPIEIIETKGSIYNPVEIPATITWESDPITPTESMMCHDYVNAIKIDAHLIPSPNEIHDLSDFTKNLLNENELQLMGYNLDDI